MNDSYAAAKGPNRWRDPLFPRSFRPVSNQKNIIDGASESDFDNWILALETSKKSMRPPWWKKLHCVIDWLVSDWFQTGFRHIWLTPHAGCLFRLHFERGGMVASLPLALGSQWQATEWQKCWVQVTVLGLDQDEPHVYPYTAEVLNSNHSSRAWPRWAACILAVYSRSAEFKSFLGLDQDEPYTSRIWPQHVSCQ